LTPPTVRWPQTNTALHTATGQTEQALDALRRLQPPSPEKEDEAMPAPNDGDYDENMETVDSDAPGGKSQPLSAGDLKEAILLPVPNYTSEDILAEESATQQKRARRKAARAGAQVEKNW
jgi:hypothetical protein